MSTNKLKPKECCNRDCKNVFFLKDIEFFRKDLCDQCADKNNPKKQPHQLNGWFWWYNL